MILLDKEWLKEMDSALDDVQIICGNMGSRKAPSLFNEVNEYTIEASKEAVLFVA